MNYYSINRTTYEGRCGDSDESEEIIFFTDASLEDVREYLIINLFTCLYSPKRYEDQLFLIIKDYIEENKLHAVEITNGYGEVLFNESSEIRLYDNNSYMEKDFPFSFSQLLNEKEQNELIQFWDERRKEIALEDLKIAAKKEKAKQKRLKKKKLEEEYQTFLLLQKKFKDKN